MENNNEEDEPIIETIAEVEDVIVRVYRFAYADGEEAVQLVLLYQHDDDAMALKEFLQTLDEGQIIEASQENLHDEDGSYWETRIVTVKV